MNDNLYYEVKNKIMNICKNYNIKVYTLCIMCIASQFYRYTKFLQDMLNEEGYSENYEGIVFSKYIDDIDDDSPFIENDKIYFVVFEGKDVLTYEETYNYLEISTNVYLQYYPKQKQELQMLLEKIKAKYLS